MPGKSISELTVFTNGDSGKVSTWSNIPYFFTETLIARGIKINRVDLTASVFPEKVFYRVLRLFKSEGKYDYFRSFIHFTDVKRRIKKAIRLYPNSQVNILLTFSFTSAGLTKKPTILFCDWTFEHSLNYFLHRAPNFFERQAVRREKRQIERSDLVISLFPGVAKEMKNRYKNKNIHYLGNVINSLQTISGPDVIGAKILSNNLLFVGSVLYREGAQSLIQAFEKVKQKNRHMILHIIGMKSSDFENLPTGVYCHGYLDKGKEADRELYYKLFREARLFINTTPKWGAFSATIEAMYFYTPVLISPYDEFLETFGSDIDFGSYCEQNTPDLIAGKIAGILSHPDYESLCLNSHKAVSDFTWDAFIDKLISTIKI